MKNVLATSFREN